jgi:hypothetical protein
MTTDIVLRATPSIVAGILGYHSMHAEPLGCRV